MSLRDDWAQQHPEWAAAVRKVLAQIEATPVNIRNWGPGRKHPLWQTRLNLVDRLRLLVPTGLIRRPRTMRARLLVQALEECLERDKFLYGDVISRFDRMVEWSRERIERGRRQKFSQTD